MRYAGAIRLDHVLGLKRLYLVPHGFAANNGAYVQMPFERCWRRPRRKAWRIVGGDRRGSRHRAGRLSRANGGLGHLVVSGDDVRARRIMARFAGIDHYASNALVTFNTHDLSTYAGWRSFSDLALKRSLGIDPTAKATTRDALTEMLTEVLRHHAIDVMISMPSQGFLRGPIRLLAISLEDLLGVTDQPNIRTVNQHPNWRRRLPLCDRRDNDGGLTFPH